MFGGSKGGGALDADRSLNPHGLTGLERAKLERSLHSDEPYQRVPQPPAAPSKPAIVSALQSVPAPQPEPAPQSLAPWSEPAPQPVPTAKNEAHLYVGPGVNLKGEIAGCDTLRIEGTVDGNAVARQLILCPGGSYLGTAEIDEAEIEGSFDGTLNVRGRLILRNNGCIGGTLSYGEIEIERGGKITGQITPHGEQIAARSRSQAAVAPASDEWRANSAPRPLQQSIVQPPRAAPVAASPPAVETPVKARKVQFFGRG
jgi:cytoskeletal protein CcmA (bactofilin family)